MSWQIKSEEIQLPTQGPDQLVNLTEILADWVKASGIQAGTLTVFVPGATASITTLEYEPGLIEDVTRLLQQLIPFEKKWAHHRTWGDDNGGSHLRAALIGPSLSIPVVEGKLTLGIWQQVVLIEHDTQSRSRRIRLQLMGY